MTISTTIIKNSYSGNGSTTAFTYNFKITAETEIQVIVKTNATGAESVRSIGTGSTNYSVSGVGNNSGTVTFVTAPTSSETVVLRRSTAQTQAMDLIDNDPMSADTIETAHDKSIAIAQELQEQIDKMKSPAGKKKYEMLQKEYDREFKKHVSNLTQIAFFQNYIIAAKMLVIYKLNSVKSIGTFIRTSNGFKAVNPEGYVAIDRVSGGAVKLVDRMEFSFNNFTAAKAWDK